MSIIVGYDGSDFAMQALDWAMDEAELRKLPLIVAHTWRWPYGEATQDAKAHLRQAAEHVLWHGADCASKTSAIAAVSTDLFEGEASERLVELSAGADLVVVGSRGLRTLSRAVLGSVAGHVASYAYCPVIVVRGPGPLPQPLHPGPIAAIIGGDDHDAVLDFAVREAELRQLPSVETSLRHLEEGASLVVAGRLRKGHLGSVARTVLREAACPVAIVPGDRDLRP